MNLKPNQNLRKESVKYKSNKKYKYLLFSGLALCSLSLEAKLNNDQVKAESEKAQTSTKLEKDPLTGFSNTKNNIAFNDNPLLQVLQEDTGNTSFNNSLVTVNKDNFTSHFVLNGNAKWSVKDNRGILLLTDDNPRQAGNATLSTKISVNDEFHLRGKINLGTKSQGQGGADGIALAFHTGDSNQIGDGGGCLGIAGLPFGFGFKLDTFYNSSGKYSDNGAYKADPARFNTKDGNQSFGAFAHDEIENNVSTVITYDGEDAPAQKIPEPSNNTFRDFQADYNGTTHVLTIKYDNDKLTWSKCIDDWIPTGTTSLSFAITGVTGASFNKQEFEIDEFKYTGYGVVNTNFVNTEDNNASIASIPQSNAKINTEISLTKANDKIKEIEQAGTYYLTGASIKKGETTSDFDPNKTELMATEDPQTITYKFAPVKTALETKADSVVIYAGDDFNPEVGFESAKDKDGSSLPFNKITVDNKVNKDTPGQYFVNYSYTPKGYKDIDLKKVSKDVKVNVIDRKYVNLKYVDQNGNVIDPKYLADVSEAMSSGQHRGAYGSQFTLNPSKTLTLNNKTYYEFKEAKLGPNSIDPNINLTFGDSDQEVTLVYQGATVNSDDPNAITVHHYLEGTTTTVPGMNDTKIGGLIGDEITVDPATEAHQAPTGYTLAPNQTAFKWTLKPDEGKEVAFYYTANTQSNITVKFVNAKNGNEVKSDKPEGKTGDELDLQADGKYIPSAMPEGYHYAKGDELNGKTQPDNVKYTPTAQTVTVYVAGNKVDSNNNASSQITVHHYLKGTTTTVPGMSDTLIGGFIGDEITIDPTAEAHQAPAGYTLDSDQTAVKWTLKPNEGKEVTFYYTADEKDNITVEFVNADTQEVVSTDKPKGHTGETLDLSKDGKGTEKLPAGYHYATEAELANKTDSNNKPLVQPTNPVYTNEDQTKKIYIIGDTVAEDAANAITVHHYLENTTTKVIEDKHIGGRVGETITITPVAAANGYTLAANQTAKEWKLDATQGKEFVFYYTADETDNITVNFVDANTQEVISTDKPKGHTGEHLDLSQNGKGVQKLPKGYHYATADELKDKGLKQPENPTYTTESQSKDVYVVGNKVAANDENALTVHYYLKGTTQKLKPDRKVGGQVGVETVIEKDADEQKAPAGYTMDAEQTDQKYTFKPEGAGEVAFYYTADVQSNITVKFVNAKNGKQVKEDNPEGKTGDELNLQADGTYLQGAMPEGYHYAQGDELKGKTQPDNVKYTPNAQTVTVYIFGDKVDDQNNASSQITVHHYLEDTTTTVPGMSDTKIGGNIGDEITIDPKDPAHQAPAGYTLAPGQEPHQWTLKPNEGKEVTFYYTANSQSNITVKFVNAKNGKQVKEDKPEGKTGDELNLQADGTYLQGAMPAGYHYAKGDELKGKTQPGNLKYGLTAQTATVYIVGDEVNSEKNASSQVIVHHYLEGTTTTVPGMNEVTKGGYIGDTVITKATDPEQKAPAGYTLVSGPEEDKWELQANKGHEVIYYYKADELNNITIDFVDISDRSDGSDGKIVKSYTPTGKHINDTLDPLNSNEIQGRIPKGYHYAEGDELNGKEQPGILTYDLNPKTVKVYIAKDDFKKKIKVTFIDVDKKNQPIGDKTIEPSGKKYGDEINLDEIIKNEDIPLGYRRLTQAELNRLGINQDKTVKLTDSDVEVNYYVLKKQEKVEVKITHMQINSRTGKLEPIRSLKNDITQTIVKGDPLEIDTNQAVHRAPAGYRIMGISYNKKDEKPKIERNFVYNPVTGLIKGIIPEEKFINNPITITIVYRRL